MIFFTEACTAAIGALYDAIEERGIDALPMVQRAGEWARACEELWASESWGTHTRERERDIEAERLAWANLAGELWTIEEVLTRVQASLRKGDDRGAGLGHRGGHIARSLAEAAEVDEAPWWAPSDAVTS